MTNLEEYKEPQINSSPQFIRDTPIGNLILLGLLGMGGVILLSLFTLILGSVTGVNIVELMKGNVQDGDSTSWWTLRILLILNSVMIFLIPGILYNYIADKAFLNRSGKEINKGVNYWSWAFLFFGVSLPVVLASAWLNQQIELPEWAKLSEENVNEIITSLLGERSIPNLMINLLVMALLPALGEEWFFRGSLQRILTRLMHNEIVAVFATAFLFSLLHFQLEGFLPRFLLGIVLGYIFLKTGNLWVSILLHFLFNGAQIFMAYSYGEEFDRMNSQQMPAPNWWVIGVCACLMIYTFINPPTKTNLTNEREI